MGHRLKLTLAIIALQLFAALPAAHGLKVPAQERDTLLPGMWGGRHIRFEVTEGGASVEFDCAHATVEGPIVVDARGRFNVYGMYYEAHGAAGYRVRLSGRVGGSLLKLNVTRAGTRRVVGSYTLSRDREPELVKCR